MKSLKLMILVAVLATTLSIGAFAQGTQIVSCDTNTDWAASLPYAGAEESATLEVESTIKQEGAASLKLTYVYKGNAYHEAVAAYTPTTPIDLSSALKFSFKLYGDAAADADLLWYVVFTTKTGKVFRYVNWAGLGPSEWQDIEIPLRDMETAPYATASDNPITSVVDKISFILQKNGDNTNSGTGVVYIDDIRFDSVDDGTEMVMFENFEYTDDAALQAAWVTSASGAGNSITATLGTGIDGKALQLNATIALRWYGLLATYTLPETADWGQYDFIRLWVKGQDAALYPAGTGPLLMIYLEDQVTGPGNQKLRAFIPQGTKEAGWVCYVVYLRKCDITGMGGWPDVTAPFVQDKWDGVGDGNDVNWIDFSHINKIHFNFTENALDASYTTTILIDKIEFGHDAPPPPPPPTPTPLAVRETWNIYE